MTFNDADLIYTTYYSFIRIPAHQSVEVECLAGDAIKVGVCYYIDAPEVITGRNNGCHDLWRIKSNETMKIAYVGPNKGAGLEMPNSKIVFQGKKTFTFNSADSKSVKSTMKSIQKWEESHPNVPVYK